VPEVGGPIDPKNEAHDLVMSVFGEMSKGERNRIKIRVKAAMGAVRAILRPGIAASGPGLLAWPCRGSPGESPGHVPELLLGGTASCWA
jgi:hypothetical protein